MAESPAVKLWRDKFKYNLPPGRKYDIEVTVRDLDLWKYVLDNWGYVKNGKWRPFNPFSVGKQLSEYERLEGNGRERASRYTQR